MKKIFSLLTGIVFTTMACTAQPVHVPEKVVKAFTLKFPEASNVTWGKESAKEYEAEFEINNRKISANFGTEGNWLETESTIPENEVPPAVLNAIRSKFEDAEIVLSEKTEKPGNKVYYEILIKTGTKKKELELNGDGSFIK